MDLTLQQIRHKELFLKAVLESAERIVARALENGPASNYELQLHRIWWPDPTWGTPRTVVHGETLIEIDDTWIVGTQYRREELP